MGETACFAHAFPCDSGAPNEANKGNPLDALGESVSFGRFMQESLAWDKWSAFPQKRHVEEAEKYSQPGSVAQKKAFFEAHYKQIAAMKAAALLEQEQQGEICNNKILDLQTMMLSSQVGSDEQKEVKIQNTADGCVSNVKPVDMNSPMNDESLDQLNNTENQTVISSITPQIQEPLVKKPAVVSSLKSLVCEEVSKAPCSPSKPKAPPYPRKENIVTPTVKISRIESTDKNRPSPKSLRKLMSSSPVREPDTSNTPAAQAVEISRVAPGSSSNASKDSAITTILPTMPTTAYVSEVQKHPLTTTFSETRRTKTPSACGGKTTRSKWRILFALFSKSLRACRKKLCPSMLSSRKQETASRRKQKVQEKKFNDIEALELELQTKFKQVETEVKKLRKSLFSNSQKLPDFYNARENSKNKQQIPQSSKL